MSDETARHDEGDGDAHADGASPLTVVSALMDERRKFESWLIALEARRASTPDRVFTRVHADYTARLEDVVEELTTHAEGLRAELDTLTARLSSLDELQQQQRDQRAEAELRAHVGELSPHSWEELSTSSDRSLGDLAAQHTEVERELSRTRELLQEAERPATPRGAATVPEQAESRADAVVAPAAGVVEEAGHPGQHPAEPLAASAEAPTSAEPENGIPAELTPSVIAAEAQLVESDAAADRRDADVTPAPTQRADATHVPPERAGGFDELAFLSSVVDTPLGTVDIPAPSDRPDERTRRASFATRASEEIVNLSDDGSSALDASSKAREGPLAMNVSGNIPIVIRDKTAETAKSLKCSDCGAMNYPTEWYCERCGAELASL